MLHPRQVIGAAVCIAVFLGLSIPSSGAYLSSSEPLQITMHFVIPKKHPVKTPHDPNVILPITVPAQPLSSNGASQSSSSGITAEMGSPKSTEIPSKPAPQPSQVPTVSPTPSDSTS